MFEVGEQAKGWLNPGEGETLHSYAKAVAHLGPLVEIGGYCGKSACYIGAAAQAAGQLLFSVDWHRGSPEMAPGRECHDSEMVGLDGVFDTLPHFRRTIRAAGLEDTVVPVAGSSVIVGPHWNTPISFLFIDGAHDEGVTADYMLWAKHVVPGGLLVFHDQYIPVIQRTGELAVAEGFTPHGSFKDLRVLRCSR